MTGRLLIYGLFDAIAGAGLAVAVAEWIFSLDRRTALLMGGLSCLLAAGTLAATLRGA